MTTRKLKAESSKLKAKTRGRRKRRIKSASRIPGVQVGDEVSTSLGVRKKVCFNVGGRWVFRMVDTDWRAPGRPLKKLKGQSSKSKRSEDPARAGLKGKGKTPRESDK